MAGLTKIKTGGFAAGCALPSDATATTQSASDNSQKLATTAYVDNAVGGISADKITEGNTTVEVVDTGSDGHITFDTEGSERMRIDNTGRVGIGATDNSGYSGSSDNLVIKDASNAGITIHSGSSSTGCIRFADGTSSNAEKLDAAIEYNHNSEVLTLRTNDTARMTIVDSTGNVGIGVTPTDFGTGRKALELHSSGATVTHLALTNSTTQSNGSSNGFNLIQNGNNTLLYLRETGFMSFSSADTERMRIDSSGRLLVGATSSSINVKAVIQGNSSNATTQGILAIARGSDATEGARTLGSLYFTNNAHTIGAQIDSATTEAWTSTTKPAFLSFSTNDGAANAATEERMRIAKDGKIGIGTSSPQTVIHAEAAQAELQLKSTGGTNSAGVRFIPGGQSNAYYIYANGSRDLIFEDHTSERMRITSAGRVGINTSNPGDTLDVNGSSFFRGTIDLTAGNNIQFTNSGGSQSVQINADDCTASYNLTLPPVRPNAGEVLKVNTGGVNTELEWGGAGKVLQCKHLKYTSRYSVSTQSFVTVTNFTLNFTPISSSSTIVVQVVLGAAGGSSNSSVAKIVRDSTDVMVGDASGSGLRVGSRWMGNQAFSSNHCSGSVLTGIEDSPGTSQVTYKLQVRGQSGQQGVTINQSGDAGVNSDTYGSGAASSMVIWEISS